MKKRMHLEKVNGIESEVNRIKLNRTESKVNRKVEDNEPAEDSGVRLGQFSLSAHLAGSGVSFVVVQKAAANSTPIGGLL